MRDLFFAVYGYDGIGWTICCLLFLLIGIILFIVSLVKLKKKAKIAGIIVSVLLIWQIVPVGFYLQAYLCRSELPFSVAIDSNPQNYKFNNNYKDTVKYMKIAANTSLIPWQKGAIYCHIAFEYGASKQGPKAIEYYNKAYKYIKSYKYKSLWLTAPLVYDTYGDTEKAIEIAESLKLYSLAAIYYIAKEKYPEALDAANKGIQLSPNSFGNYLYRAYINRVIGNKNEEIANYQKALSLTKTEKQKQMVLEYKQIRNKELARKKQAAINMGFIKE